MIEPRGMLYCLVIIVCTTIILMSGNTTWAKAIPADSNPDPDLITIPEAAKLLSKWLLQREHLDKFKGKRWVQLTKDVEKLEDQLTKDKDVKKLEDQLTRDEKEDIALLSRIKRGTWKFWEWFGKKGEDSAPSGGGAPAQEDKSLAEDKDNLIEDDKDKHKDDFVEDDMDKYKEFHVEDEEEEAS